MENEKGINRLNFYVEALKVVKREIKKSFGEKSRLEQAIVDEVEKLGLEDVDFVSDIVEVATVFENRLDHNILQVKFPDVYKWGLVPKFDYKHALKAFEDKRVFWQIISECKLPYEVKKVKPKRKNKYGRNQKGT